MWIEDPNIVACSTQLPPGCSTASSAADPCVTAEAAGAFPHVFNNDGVHGSFDAAQPTVLDELDPATGRAFRRAGPTRPASPMRLRTRTDKTSLD